MGFMTARPMKVGGHRRPTSRRSGYTGEDGYEISVTATRCGRSSGSTLLADPRGEADRPRRARFAAARSRPLPLRPRHRHRRPRRSRPGSTWSIQKRRREEGGFPGAAAHPARVRRGRLRASASACGRRAGRRPAKAPRSRRPTARASAWSPPAASARPSTGPSPWAMWRRTCRRPARSSHLIVRGKALPAQVVADALRPPPLQALTRNRKRRPP